MRRRDAIVLSFCLGIVTTAVLYVVNPRAPIYYPLERSWSWVKTPGVPLMAWYGRSLWAIGGGLVVLAVAIVASRRWASDRPAPKWLPATLVWVTVIALLVALGDTVLHEHATWMRR